MATVARLSRMDIRPGGTATALLLPTGGKVVMFSARSGRRVLAAALTGLVFALSSTAPAMADAPTWHVKALTDELDGPVGVVGATVVQPGHGLPQEPYFFSTIGPDLWVKHLDNGFWDGGSLGSPSPTVSVVRGVGAVTGQLYAWEPQRPFAFVIGSDGHLWTRSRAGGVWTGWQDQGTPTGTTVSAAVGAVAVHDSPSAAGRPYVFVLGGDGHLWVNWWNGGRWQWYDQGVPPGSTLSSSFIRVGVTTTQPVTEGSEYPQAFLLDAQRNLWRHGWNGSAWEWANYGRPSSAAPGGIHGLGVVNDNGLEYRTTYVSAFVAVNNMVYEYTLPTSGPGQWMSRSGISGTTYVSALGVINPRTSYGDRLARLFLASSHVITPISVNTWRATGWTWGTVPGTSITDSGGWNTGDTVTAVRDPGLAVDVPYVFYWSDKNQMTVAWLE
ncbi:hypothetical protein K1W54_07620 [Micromonospora sp. CPCC 205371]|nr:hypothetical protein [Micromonospora sp. CPCC 205371]